MKTLHKILFLASFIFFFQGNSFAQITEGSFFIGTGETHNNFTDAIGNLGTSLTGNVIFNVKAGVYNEQIILPNITTNGHTIAFKKAAGETGEVLIDFDPPSNNYIVQINGSNYTFENINFVNSSLTENIGCVIDFAQTSDVENINFNNCLFRGRENLDIDQDSNPFYSIIRSTDNGLTNISFINDTIIGGSYSFYINTPSASSNFLISECEILNFYNTGIYSSGLNDFHFINNTILDRPDYASAEATGIYIDSPNFTGFNISGNVIILDREYSKTCIKLSNITEYPDSEKEYLVSNNMLTTRYAGIGFATIGIWLEYCSYINVINNSVHIQDGNSTGSTAFNIFDGANSLSSDITLLNNLLINSGGGYAMKLQDAGALSNFDNNDYYTSGTNLIFSDVVYTDLYSWQTVDNQNYVDVNSFSALPHFISTTDLHIDDSQPSYIENRGSLTTSVTLDIDGEQRDIISNGYVDVGADEGAFNLLWTGDILGNANWNGNVFVETNITIDGITGMSKGATSGGDLYINPGTTVKFMNLSSITAKGNINAVGTKEQGIVFTSEGGSGNETWGGIFIDGTVQTPGMVMFQYCVFENSSKTSGGGGALSIDSNSGVTIRNCKFNNNHASLGGGAIYTIDCSPIIDANSFTNNNAQNGGAIYSRNMEAIISNNEFAYNGAVTSGGAIYIQNTSTGPISFMNNTFYNNSAMGGEDLFLDNTQVLIYNSIFWNDGNDVNVYETNGQMNSITNCIIKNGVAGTNITTYTELLGNDPLFIDPANMDFSVQVNSVAVDGGSYITGQDTEFDILGNPRVYNYGTVDIGAYELQAPRLFADAGEDLSYCYKSQYLPDMYSIIPYQYQYQWTVLNNNEAYISSAETLDMIKNLPPGIPVDVMLSVTNGFITVTDTVTITNTQPYVNAGEDILLINSNINNNIYPDTAFNASAIPGSGWYGMWTMLSSTAVPAPTIEDTQINNPNVTDIHYGVSNFMWTIFDEGSCSNSDTVLIVAGHSYSSIPDGSFDWNTPSDWQEGTLPGPADSVTIYGVNGNVNIPGAICDRLYIGNGGTLNIEGTTKSASSLTCRTLTVEENAKKFKNIKGTANIYIKDFSTLNIGSEFISKSKSSAGSGLFIGNGGTVFIRPNAEKGSGTKASAGLNIGSGGFIFIRPNAEKGTKATAGLSIGSGGFVFIRPNAEKSNNSKSLAEGDIVIGAGGELSLEQTITGTSGGYLELSGGRTIYVSPSTTKAAGGNFGIYGGTVFIRPNAEKSAKASGYSGIFCGQGGTIFIRPNAEKANTQSSLISPVLTIDGGKVVIGNNVKSKLATGSFQFNQIFIRPNAEKGFANDTSIIVYPSGELALSDAGYFDQSFIAVPSNKAISFMEGSNIQLENTDFKTSQFNLMKGASLIDMNPSCSYDLTFEDKFNIGKRYLFSPSVETIPVMDFGENKTMGRWDETSSSWLALNDADMLNAGTGYFVTYDLANSQKFFYGKANTGEFNIPVTLTDVGDFKFEGWNLVGNPYPSAIDLEKIDLPVDFYGTFYTFDPISRQFMLYQQGGVSLNGASQYVMPNEAFFLKTDANSIFNIGNEARVHFMNAAKNTNVANNILKLKVSGVLNSDETAVLFNQNATDNFDKEYDAAKFFSTNVTKPIIYTKIAGEDAPIAINTFEYNTNSRTIPLYFETGTIGSYTIDVSDLNFDASVTVFLKDLKDNSMHDLKTNPSYSFIYTNGDAPNRFEIILDGFVGVEDIASNNNLNIFSNKNTIFINTTYNNSRVEVYDLNGKLLLQKNIFNSGINSIDVNLAQSIYLVKLISDKETICKKVVISK